MSRQREIWRKALRAASVWLAHVLLVIVVLCSFRLIEGILEHWWGEEDPLSRLFDWADIGVAVVLCTFGLWGLIIELKRDDDES